MAENTPTVFNSKLIDLQGLSDFWAKIKTYILTAVAVVDQKADDINTALGNKITENESAIESLGNAITDITKDGGAIDTKIAALNPDSNSNTSKYATNVQVVDGKIEVTYAELPEGADWQPAINTAKGEAIEAAAEALETHAAAKVSTNADAGGIHVNEADRTKWDSTATKLDTFLKDADLNDHLFDTLKEIQGYINTDGNAADALVNRVNTLEGRASNLEAADEALGKRIDDLIGEIEKNKETTASALTDLDTRITKNAEDLAGLAESNTAAHAGFTSSIEAIQNLLSGMKLANKAEIEAIVVYP